MKRFVFVVGNSRSGTTMMAHMLGGHPHVFTFNELHFFEQLWTPEDEARRPSKTEAERLAARLLCIQRDGYLNQKDPGRFSGEARELVTATRAELPTSPEVFELFLHYETTKNGKAIPCDHTPRNVFYIDEILGLYPEARIINIVRDPRDVLLSQKRKWRRRLQDKNIPVREAFRSWVNYHPITISKLWVASVRAAERFAGNVRVHSVRFEDLLADPEGVTHKICEFIDITPDTGVLEVPQVGSSSEPDRPEQRGVNRERAGSWRKGGLNPTEVFLCQKIAGGLMKRHGYELVSTHRNLLRLSYSVVSFPVKLALAFLLNLRRMRRVVETIGRRL